ncbi:hypothetical protein CLNEO_23420 [Anaerotignum neopropionicum]|uniref:Uncharacterized protein n=1 Tax=Anaerotignum neopropionicum TaxID=36847 RepID=A0A136WCD9_9FIRM|nr:hypothetical protein [Anaerotignum neopropionicum]KXL52177.1 hypothetical protein CLNEO_23420 [Anaerotignum neopropionicum]
MSFLWIGWELLINIVEEGMFCYLLTKTLGYHHHQLSWWFALPLEGAFTNLHLKMH